MRSRGWLTLALLAAAVGGCSKPKSFIVLTLHSADATPIPGVTAVVVTVTQGTSFSKQLTYSVGSGKAPLVLNQVNTNDLSVSFSGARSGPVDLSVKVFDASGCAVGSFDHLSVTIRQGEVVSANVPLTAQSCLTSDGGVGVDGGGDGGSGDAFPGCDPVMPICTVPGDTCQVDCTTQLGECTQGGTGGPGTPCKTNKDCAPGAQCFDYAGTGCAVKVCLRFCNDDNGCMSPTADGGAVAEAGAPDAAAQDAAAPDGGDAHGVEGGASSASGASSGPRSVCQGLVPCGQVITAYHTCTFACDPRQVAAAAGATRCPAGLSCLVVGDMDQVDCACAEGSRTGVDGADCAGGADCAPGYICNLMADNSGTNTKKCRAICRCDAKDMSCTATNECGNKTCSALKNDATFGVCL